MSMTSKTPGLFAKTEDERGVKKINGNEYDSIESEYDALTQIYSIAEELEENGEISRNPVVKPVELDGDTMILEEFDEIDLYYKVLEDEEYSREREEELENLETLVHAIYAEGVPHGDLQINVSETPNGPIIYDPIGMPMGDDAKKMHIMDLAAVRDFKDYLMKK